MGRTHEKRQQNEIGSFLVNQLHSLTDPDASESVKYIIKPDLHFRYHYLGSFITMRQVHSRKPWRCRCLERHLVTKRKRPSLTDSTLISPSSLWTLWDLECNTVSTSAVCLQVPRLFLPALRARVHNARARA